MAERMESPLRREQIADAALSIVVEQGIGAVTVRRVAEAVGISAAALYRHYKNKADILAAVLEEHNTILDGILQKAQVEATGPLDALQRLYTMLMELVEPYRALPVIFLSDVLWFEDVRLRTLKLEHHQKMRRAVVTLLAAGQTAKEIRDDIRPVELFVHFIGLIAMPAMMSTRSPEDVDLPRQIEANWKLFSKAVTP